MPKDAEPADAWLTKEDYPRKDEMAVWWLTEEDCHRIGHIFFPSEYSTDQQDELDELVEDPQCVNADSLPWPQYIKEEYWSRYGRHGHGRLWVPTDLSGPDTQVTDWETRPLADKCEEAGGIVIRREDAPIVRSWGGLITDMDLDYLFKTIDFEQYRRSLEDGTADQYIEEVGALPAEALLEEQDDERVWSELTHDERVQIEELLRAYAERTGRKLECDKDSCIVS